MRALQMIGAVTAAAGCVFAVMGTAQAASGKTQPVAISFALMAGGKEVGCGAPLADLGSGHLSGKLQEARLYVHGFALIDAKGERTPIALTQNEWQYADVALIDFKDARGGNAACTPGNPAKNNVVTGVAPQGAYVGLEFSVGAPVESMVDGKSVSINHSNVETAPAPLDISGMAWNWQAGRRFVTIEVIPPAPVIKPDGSKSRTWMVHLGSTGCKGNPASGEIVSCARENRFPVRLDRFDAKTQRVELDLTKLLEGSDISVDRGGAVGCMAALDDPDCPPVFAALGLNLGDSAPGANDAGRPTRPGVSPIFSVGAAETAKIAGAKQ
ncbi:MbnP family copper-binding protein [Methylosinus trichosporium]|uniref:Metallo-mystery pair system four-Cys motif protein n=1 Tax=Methylosinus trichosporium (strain ATCC 35070 / NCIMB 11131 / UNIQEM 75 / OB3b) TaxID=595536 RepID=A0A2D2D3P1_METT3|nr:MbnP family copper-binding protein [Methylosinus trichosporium]ATQ69594.1 metallo-mystery pair system four-Cys motif protein [Methylosinus trichosporium OB3b]